jgi:hypothetical protein
MPSWARRSFAAETIFIARVICWVLFTLLTRFRIARRFAMGYASLNVPLNSFSAAESFALISSLICFFSRISVSSAPCLSFI